MNFDVNTITVHNAPMRWVRQAVAFYQKFGASEDPALHFKSDFVLVYPKLIQVATQMGLISGAPGVVGSPTFSPVAGAVVGGSFVTLSSSTPGAKIYYTTDGSTPTTSSASDTGLVTVEVDGAMTIKAFASKSGMTSSAVTSAAYTLSVVATPTFSVAGGAYTEDQSVPLLCGTAGATIRYTVNGSTPTATSAIYTAPIAVSGGASGALVSTTVKAIAIKTGMTNSAIASATFDITLP